MRLRLEFARAWDVPVEAIHVTLGAAGLERLLQERVSYLAVVSDYLGVREIPNVVQIEMSAAGHLLIQRDGHITFVAPPPFSSLMLRRT